MSAIAKSLTTLAKGIKASHDKLTDRVDGVEKSLKKLAESPVYKVAAQPIDHAEEKRWGFKSFGEYLHQVREAAYQPNLRPAISERLSKGVEKSWGRGVTKAALGLNDAVDSEGGFLVPPEFSNKIMERVYSNDLLSRVDKMTVTGNTMRIPAIDETSRADGSRFGGVQAYWVDEAGTPTASKPKLRHIQLTLKKLMALGYVTEELLSDAGVAMDTYLTDKFSQEIEFKIGDALVNGTGAAMPQGILNAAAVVSVAKETGQAAATIVPLNIWKMYQRMWAPSRSKAVWLINQDVEHQLFGMVMPGATPAIPVYLPPGGVSEAPYATLLGRPVIPVEFCATLGTVGDIILVDWSEYVAITKGSIDTQMSMHVQFTTDEMAYRTKFRIDGQCKWHSALTPFKGSNTLSPIITLATRS